MNKHIEGGLNKDSERMARKRAALDRYIHSRIVDRYAGLDSSEEEEIAEHYTDIPLSEKASALYRKLMVYKRERDVLEEEGREDMDPNLISEIKVLSGDPEVFELFSSKFSEARIQEQEYSSSELGAQLRALEQELSVKGQEHKDLEKSIVLRQIGSPSGMESAVAKTERLAVQISRLRSHIDSIRRLDDLPHTPEYADVVARDSYDQFKEYQEQLKGGFVWLPSRLKIHQRVVGAILNHRWPVLMGEAGTGKSYQADAAAIELTGLPPTTVPCSDRTRDIDLIADKEISQKGESYLDYQPMMEAFTGYDDSLQEKPTYTTGRAVRLDEAYRIPPQSPAYAILKEARQRKPGDDFFGKPVLPGAVAIWTSNPPGVRYPNRHQPDAAMARELAEIEVDYPDMSPESPELFEFTITSLLDENSHIAVDQRELTPFYERKDIPEEERETLPDGRVIVAEDVIVEDMTDLRHGALWRFCGAIKSLQNAFVYGNRSTEVGQVSEDVLRFREDSDGSIEISNDGSGEILTLVNSTITLGELASWMSGFRERRGRTEEDFRVDTLTDWLNLKINAYISQSSEVDQGKLQAMFRHFGFLDKTPTTPGYKPEPMTPLTIGYLSPRVPRQVHLKMPVEVDEGVDDAQEKEFDLSEVKEHETDMVVLESGEQVLVREQSKLVSDIMFADGELNDKEISKGHNLVLEGKDFTYVGLVEDSSSSSNGMPVLKLGGEDLYRVTTEDELRLGIFFYESRLLLDRT